VLDPSYAAFIAERFSLGNNATLTGPVARGELGQVWRLTTSIGTWAVKEPFEPKSEAESREEATIQEIARDAGIPTPEVQRAAGGDVSLAVGDVRVCVNAWVDILERDPALDPVAVGLLVASIHQVRFPDIRGEDPWYREPITAERWDELARDLHAAGAPFADELASYRDELTALGAIVESPSVLQTCHRDLWADNLRATGDGALCVFDWENFGLADPGQELCLVLFEFGAGDTARTRTIYETYVETRGPGRVEAPRAFSMLIAQLGHIGEAGCTQWLAAAASSPQREHAETWVGEFLSQPLSRETIDGILDAIGSS
jgi:aminoglycoside phosphotransferase (APT) family kinase protein